MVDNPKPLFFAALVGETLAVAILLCDIECRWVMCQAQLNHCVITVADGGDHACQNQELLRGVVDRLLDLK